MKRKVTKDFSSDRHGYDGGKREKISPTSHHSSQGPTTSRSPSYHSHRGSYHGVDDRLKRKVVEAPAQKDYDDRRRRDNGTNKGFSKLKLKVTNLPKERAEDALEMKLFYQFKRFGHISVFVNGCGRNRYGVIAFKHSYQCRNAKNFCEQNSVYIFDRPANIEFFTSSYQYDMDDIGSDDSNEFDNSRSMKDNRRQHNTGKYYNEDYSGNVRRRQDWQQHRRTFDGGSSNYHYNPHAMQCLEDVPNRTLFIGNLDTAVNNTELQRIFERYNMIDIDVKRHRGQFIGYAFVKFATINEADIAKNEMDGKVLGKNRIKIGYGKVYPSKRLWLGGLGSWISKKEIEQECDRFGALRELVYEYKDKYAEVEFASLDAAKAAFEEITDNYFGRSTRRIEVEYVDTQHHYFNFSAFRDRSRPSGGDEDSYDEDDHGNRRDGGDYYHQRSYPNRSGGNYRDDDDYQRDNPSVSRRKSEERRDDSEGRRHKRVYSPRSGVDDSRNKNTEWIASPAKGSSYGSYEESRRYRERKAYTPEENLYNEDDDTGNRKDSNWMREPRRSPSSGDQKNTITSSKDSPPEVQIHTGTDSLASFVSYKRFNHWDGSFLLKSSEFLSRLFFIDGNSEFAQSIMGMVNYSNAQYLFRITQRLRLDGDKLTEVNKRIESAGPTNYCCMLAMDRGDFSKEMSLQSNSSDNPNVTVREFRNLVNYLRQKEAAGVIMLPIQDNLECIVHVFPPCEFSNDYILQTYPRMNKACLSQDHLLLILVKLLIV